MAETIGSIQVVASINTKDYDSGKKHIEKGNKDLEASSDRSASTISSKWGTAFKAIGTAAVAGIAAATTATVALTTAAVKGYAEYEQLVGGVETLFKASSKEVVGYAEGAYKTAGLSANEYMSTVTSFSASLLQGLGGDTRKAAKIGNRAVTDMSDNANKMGTSMEMIQNAYQGFAKDNFMMLDNLKLGYGGTAGEMARLVNESKVMGKGFKATAENVKDIPFDKLIESIHVIQTEMGITGTTALEASETISGSFVSMTSSWKNLVAGLANPDADFNKLMKEFTTSAQTFARNVVPAIGTALGSIVKMIDTVIPGFSDTITKIGEFGVKIGDYLMPKLTSLWQSIETNVIPVLKDLWLNVIKPLIPVIGIALVAGIGLAIDAFKLVTDGIGFLVTGIETGNPVLWGLVGLFGTLATAMAFNAVFNALTVGFTVMRLITIPSVMASIVALKAAILAPIVMPAIAVAAALAAIALVWDSYNKMQDAISNAKTAQANNDRAGEDLRRVADRKYAEGKIDQKERDRLYGVSRRASGGPVSANRPYLVGENANGSINSTTELFVPRTSGNIVNSKSLQSMLSGSNQSTTMPSSFLNTLGGKVGAKTEYNIANINISSEVDGERWLRRLTNDQEIVSNGLVPQQTYMGAT